MSHRTHYSTRIGIATSVLFILTLGISCVPTLPHLIGIQLNATEIEASVSPGFTVGLSASIPIMSPLSQDGINDVVNFSFTPASDGYYNYSIEEDVKQIDTKSRFVTVAGNSSRMLMLNGINILGNASYIEYKVMMRTSTDLGVTWSAPVETNLSDYYSSTHSGPSYMYLDLAYNSSEQSYLLGTLCAPSDPHSPTMMRFFKSFNGINWTLLHSTSFFYATSGTTFDMALSANNSEIIATVANDDYGNYNYDVYFVKLRNNGQVLDYTVLNHTNTLDLMVFLSPAIVMSPAGRIICAWYEWYPAKNNFCYNIRSSTDWGATWSSTVKLDTSHGIPADPAQTPAMMYHDSRAFQMVCGASGRIDAVMVFNRTRIYMLSSYNNGSNWVNFSLLRAYSVQSHVYSLDFKDLGDGNKTLAFTSALGGRTLGSDVYTSASSYFLRWRVVLSSSSAPMLAASPVSFTWDGRDANGSFVRDGLYVARAWIETAAHVPYPLPSEARITVDNSGPGLLLAVEDPYFSPAASPGVKDTTDITVKSSKDGTYDIYIDGVMSSRPERRITVEDAIDYHADVAMDMNARLWCVYTSYLDQAKAIYVKISDDYGSSWSLPKPLVPISEDFSGDDNPSIAIRGNTIYVVFSRWLYDLGGNFPRMDLYIVKSNDLGTTWDAPVAITSAGWYTYDFYRNPDIIVTANGTLFIAYYRTSTSPTIKQVEVRRSIDGGNTFSTSMTVFPEVASINSWARERPVSLAFDEPSETLFLMSENMTESYPSYNITAQTWVSMDWGATWMRRGSIASGHEWLYLRGITIDVLPNGTLQSLLLGITDSAKITTLRSYDGGLSWLASDLLILDDTVEFDMYAPTDVSHQDIRSGRSPRGEIFYVYGRSPVTHQNRDVYLRVFTDMEQHYHGFISTNTSLTIVWNGKSSWGSDCEEGGYEVEARVIDVAGNIAIQAQVCSIDNSIPQIVLSIPPFKDLNPSVQQQVAVQNTSSVIDYVVDLYYRFNSTGAFTRAPTSFNGTHFRQTIPSSTTDEVYFYFNATDLAGNSRLVGDIATPMLYFRPNPMVIFTSSEGVPARPLDGRITIAVRGLPAAVLKEVYLSYSLDNWATNSTVRLVLDNNTLNFRITIDGGQQYSRLDYQLFFVRLGSTDLEIAGTPGFASQEPIPPFPTFEIEYPWNVILAMVSAAFGIILGFMQIIGKRSSSKRIQARFMHMLESYSKSESASISSKKQFAKSLAAARKQRASMAEAKGLSRGSLMYRTMTIGTLACIAGGLYATYALGDGGIALLGSALGLLLSSLAFMERVNIDASDSIYIDKRPMNFLAVVHVALIIVVLAIFILAAPLVDWFNYYVVKQSFTIGPISIPRLYLSLVTPVVTSVALILYTSYHDLKNVLKRLELARVSGESWKVIWQQKEETVSKLASNVSLKIFIFLVTVSFAVISTTQIGRYAEQGMLVLLPFVIGWLGVFLIGTIAAVGKSTVKEALKSWIIEKTKPCPQCKATNLFESQHCTSCGATFAGTTTIIEKTIECKQCKERSPEGSKHCRGCGLKF